MSPTTTTTTRTPFFTPKFAIGAGVIYGTACYIGYTAIRNNQAEQEATTQFLVSENHGNTPNKKKCDCGTKNTTNFSFLTNPLRNQQYDTVAATYDADIGNDESHNLRVKLVMPRTWRSSPTIVLRPSWIRSACVPMMIPWRCYAK